ncbi:hypothetical protein FP2_24900 [Faecalibacterium prausnitzii L2-6]|uniref:Lipoprotein n=2 Tax=Faecalibacterium prausnitzii TaxID=853 RepID=D4K0K8_9FIRM|nr:hypothetical protein FP2_24900 [Faecalibacterium prausnitzii L2-6]
MKMLKKLLAVVLTGAMALTLLTACGGNAVNDKNIADALNDMAKGSLATYTFKSRTNEQAMAKAIAALSESDRHITGGELPQKVKEILGINKDVANENNFVWYGAVIADEIGTAGQAYQAMNRILSENAVKNKPEGKKPADIRYIGTALGTMTIPGGKQTTVRFIVVTAEPK